MNLEIDGKILEKFDNDIKVFFFTSGCEWTKVNITWEFEKNWLKNTQINGKNIYFEESDEKNLDWAKILIKQSTNWEHWKNDKYLFISPKVQSRCGCATSFSFERKLIDKEKLNKLKVAFKK